MQSEYHKAFYLRGKRLFSYPLNSEVEDKQLAVIEALSFEYGCPPEEIGVFLEECAPKRWDFSRDCAVERIEDSGGRERWRILNVTNGRLYTHTGPISVFAALYEAGEA